MAASDDARAVGLDTSVVLRLLTGEPPAQATRAALFMNALLQEGRPVMVSDLVAAETYFALHAHFGVPKREAARTLLSFLLSGAVIAQPGGCAVEALRAVTAGAQKPGFVDRLIHAQYLRMAGRIASFETAAGKLRQAIVLDA